MFSIIIFYPCMFLGHPVTQYFYQVNILNKVLHQICTRNLGRIAHLLQGWRARCHRTSFKHQTLHFNYEHYLIKVQMILISPHIKTDICKY